MTLILNEIKRSQHISKTRGSDVYDDQTLGKNRFYRRMKSTVDKSVDKLNHMDMNKLFNDGRLDINLDINGETNKYVVRILFGTFLKELHGEVMLLENRFSLPIVTRALIKAFNADDVYVRCSCPDAIYRQNYWLSMNGGIAGEMETRPSNKTNPNDTKGSGCKHVLAVLNNTAWLQRVARVIFNYVNYMQLHYEGLYAEKIYPAIYEKDYDELYQQDLDLFNKDELETDELLDDSELIDTANKWAREKNQFKPGWNDKNRANKLPEEDPDLISLDLSEPESQPDLDTLY